MDSEDNDDDYLNRLAPSCLTWWVYALPGHPWRGCRPVR